MKHSRRSRQLVGKKRGSTRYAKSKRGVPSTSAHFARHPRFQELWNRMTHVITKMRSSKVSLQQASREEGISPRSVIRWGGSALRKGSNGRYVVKKSDRLLRLMMVPAPDGTREVVVPESRQATLLAEYWNAVHRYLETGDASELEKFHGKYITDANGDRISLIADLAELHRLGSAGVLSFESLYARGN